MEETTRAMGNLPAQQAGWLALGFMGIRSLEAILGKMFFRKSANKTLTAMRKEMNEHHCTLHKALSDHEAAIERLSKFIQDDEELRDKMFDRLERVMDKVADNSRDLSIAVNTFISVVGKKGFNV